MADVSRRQSDSPWSWLVCFASFVTLTFNSGSYYSFGLFLPSLMKHFGENNATTGNVYILFSLVF